MANKRPTLRVVCIQNAFSKLCEPRLELRERKQGENLHKRENYPQCTYFWMHLSFFLYICVMFGTSDLRCVRKVETKLTEKLHQLNWREKKNPVLLSLFLSLHLDVVQQYLIGTPVKVHTESVLFSSLLLLEIKSC